MYAIYRSKDKAGIEVFIPFECKRCGKCCELLSQCVYDPLEGKIVAESELGLFEYYEIEVESNSPVLVKPCPFLTDGNCSIHPIRPESCREFPLGKHLDWGIGCPSLREVEEKVRAIENVIGKLEFLGKM